MVRESSPSYRRLHLFVIWLTVALGGGALTLMQPPSGAAGSISFSQPLIIPLNHAGDVSTCDFDQDGYLDVAVDSRRQVTVLYGDGAGAFTPVDYDGGDNGELSEVLGADVNADGRPDLLFLLEQASKVAIRLNLGNRTFDEVRTYPVGRKPYGVCAGDFNEDGWNDLAVSADDGHEMCLLTNREDGTFGPYQGRRAGSYPARILTTDFNHDGNLDLAMSAYVSADVHVWLGDGTGAFAQSDHFGVGSYPAQVVTADFNRDGHPDLATANTFGHSITTRFGNGAGQFSNDKTYSTIQYPHMMRAVDLDNDGWPDLAAPNNGTDRFSILRNNGDGTMAAPFTVPSGGTDTRTLTIGDYNSDGRMDLAVGTSGTKSVSFFFNTTPVDPPAAPVELTAEGLTSGSVAVEWTPPPAGVGRQELETRTAASGFAPIAMLGATASTFTHTGLTPSTEYRYRVRAVNAGGPSDYSDTATATTGVGLKSLRLRPARVKGGRSVKGTLALTGPAPTKGAVVNLTSDSASFGGPASVTVKAGKTSARVTIRTKRTRETHVATITATLSETTRQVRLKIAK